MSICYCDLYAARIVGVVLVPTRSKILSVDCAWEAERPVVDHHADLRVKTQSVSFDSDGLNL